MFFCGKTTGTGNGKRRTLRKSKRMAILTFLSGCHKMKYKIYLSLPSQISPKSPSSYKPPPPLFRGRMLISTPTSVKPPPPSPSLIILH